MKRINHKWLIAAFGLLVLFIQSSCRKLVEVDMPIDKTTSEYVFNNPGTAIAAMTGIYAALNYEDQAAFTGAGGPSICGSLYSDELTNNSGYFEEYQNLPTGNTGKSPNLWDRPYRRIIFRVNSIIEGLSSSKTLDERTKAVLSGEAKFIRALNYFHLVNFFGDVPLVLTTDLKTNSNITRSPKSAIYDQIVADLKSAQQDLTDTYLGNELNAGNQERIRPNRAAATALLARVYLYNKRWAEAEAEASKLINNTSMFRLEALDQVFLKGSKEAIWQVQPNKTDFDGSNTPDARLFLKEEGNPPELATSESLLSAFEDGDQRKQVWTKIIDTWAGSFTIPFKYKLGLFTSDQQEYTMVLRLGEQYLIRAEARIELGNAEGCRSDLNELRKRADLDELTILDPNLLRNAVLQERRVELFTEFGHRWFDLKRLNKIDAVMQAEAPKKGGVWEPYKALLPIPYSEFIYNPALQGHQNPNYPERQ